MKQDERTPGHLIRPHAVSILSMSKEALGQSLNEAWDEIERLRNAYGSTDALRSALAEELVWHEAAEKALSKQPPSGDRGWRRAEHQERIDAIRAALTASPAPKTCRACKGFGCVDDDPEVRGSVTECWKCGGSGFDSPAPSTEGLREALAGWDIEDIQCLRRMVPDLDAVMTHNPIAPVYFRAGLLACRETMARFVEQGGNPEIAASIRANWWPSLGDDPGAPRQLAYEEVADEKPSGRIEHADTPTNIEALGFAWCFLNSRTEARTALAGVTDPQAGGTD